MDDFYAQLTTIPEEMERLEVGEQYYDSTYNYAITRLQHGWIYTIYTDVYKGTNSSTCFIPEISKE